MKKPPYAMDLILMKRSALVSQTGQEMLDLL